MVGLGAVREGVCRWSGEEREEGKHSNGEYTHSVVKDSRKDESALAHQLSGGEREREGAGERSAADGSNALSARGWFLAWPGLGLPYVMTPSGSVPPSVFRLHAMVSHSAEGVARRERRTFQ